MVVEEEVEAFGVELVGDGGGFGEVVDEGIDVFGVGEDVLAAVEDDDGEVEFLGGLLGALHHVAEGGEEVGIGGGLLGVEGVFGDTDFVLAGEAFEREADFGKEEAGEVGEGDFPLGEVAANVGDGRGEDHGIAEVFAVLSFGVGVENDERAHAFAAPDDFRFGVLFADEGGEGGEVFEPVFTITNVASSVFDGVISLPAGFGSVEGDLWEVGEDVFGERAVVGGGSADAVNTNDDELGPLLGHPLGVGQLIPVKGMKVGVVEADFRGVGHGILGGARGEKA